MPSHKLNINLNRKTKKYSNIEMGLRILWGFARLFFIFSPRTFFGWRNWLLRKFGAKVGKKVNIYNTATIYMPWNLEIGDWSSIGEHVYIYNLGKITIGSKTTISHRAHLCAGTHDYRQRDLPLIKPPIVIEDCAWICADSFIGPGVRVGEGAIVAARAVVIKDIGAWDIAAGNPATIIKKRTMVE